MNNKIRLIRHEQQAVTAISPNKYEFNSCGRLPWLQKLLFKLLSKLGANSLDRSVAYKTTEIDTSSILTALMESQRDVTMLYNKRARYVIMGPRDFARFSNEPEIRDMLRFHFTSQIGYNNTRAILGMEVVIVPWIDGFFVLPDLEDVRAVAAG